MGAGLLLFSAVLWKMRSCYQQIKCKSEQAIRASAQCSGLSLGAADGGARGLEKNGPWFSLLKIRT